MRKDVDPKILEAANAYVGFPQEVDEDIATTMKRNGFVDGAVWRQDGFWKDAQGDDLPDIDREVIVLARAVPKDNSSLRVCFGHRPDPRGWDGKDILTGKKRHHDVQTYDKGGWNMPDIVYWLDLNLPKNYDGNKT